MFSKYSDKCYNIVNQVSELGVWHFNPPAAPHFGGLWETAVKSAKYHIKRVIGETALKFEEMSTLLATIEACMNSRPLAALSDNPDDLQVITPAHFLLGRSMLSLPAESTLTLKPVYLGCLPRWRMLNQLRDNF